MKLRNFDKKHYDCDDDITHYCMNCCTPISLNSDEYECIVCGSDNIIDIEDHKQVIKELGDL